MPRAEDSKPAVVPDPCTASPVETTPGGEDSSGAWSRREHERFRAQLHAVARRPRDLELSAPNRRDQASWEAAPEVSAGNRSGDVARSQTWEPGRRKHELIRHGAARESDRNCDQCHAVEMSSQYWAPVRLGCAPSPSAGD